MKIVPRFGDLEIVDGRIGDFSERKYPEIIKVGSKKGVIDAGGRVATLPLVNFHDHIYSRLAKGVPATGAMGTFPEILENLWWRLDRALDREMIAACTVLAVQESIRNGVTYIFDHHASPAMAAGSLTLIADILEKNRMRGVLCYETSDRNGMSSAIEGLEENTRFIGSANGPDIKGMMGLHAPFTLSDKTLTAAGNRVKKLSTGIHIHIAEDRHEIGFSRDKFGISPAQRLKNHHLLNNKSMLVHGVHLESGDLALIAESGGALVFNPDSNLNNAVGLPVYASLPEDIPVLTGTDGMHANIAHSLKQLFLLYRMQGNGFDDSFAWIRKIYFDQLAFARRWFPDFPGLCTDDRADLILWDYVPPTPFSAENFWGHFVYGMLESRVHTVIQEGQPLMLNFALAEGLKTNISSIFRQGEKLFNLMQT